MVKKAVLWDLDGTLLDSVTVMFNIVNEIFSKFQLPKKTRAEIKAELHGSLEDSLIRLSAGFVDQQSLLDSFIQAQQSHYLEPATFDPLIELIPELHSLGIDQAVVTSRADGGGRGPGGAREVLKTLDIDKYMGAIVSANDTSRHKPHPEPLIVAMRKLKVEKDNSVMIGDQHVDVIAAKAAGVHSIVIDHESTANTEKRIIDSNPDAIFSNPHDIKKYLLELFELEKANVPERF